MINIQYGPINLGIIRMHLTIIQFENICKVNIFFYRNGILKIYTAYRDIMHYLEIDVCDIILSYL